MFPYSGSLHFLLKRSVHWIEIIGKNLSTELTVRIIFGTPVKAAEFAAYFLLMANPRYEIQILVMGYNADKHAALLSPPSGKRKRKLNFTLEITGKKEKVLNIFHAAEKITSDFNFSSQIIDSGDPPLENFEGLDDQKRHYEATIISLNEKINSLEMQVHN